MKQTLRVGGARRMLIGIAGLVWPSARHDRPWRMGTWGSGGFFGGSGWMHGGPGMTRGYGPGCGDGPGAMMGLEERRGEVPPRYTDATTKHTFIRGVNPANKPPNWTDLFAVLKTLR